MAKHEQKDGVLRYALEKWGTEPEYLWKKYPNYAILRQANNKKWYAAILEVPKSKLGLSGEGMIDILDVKCDQRMIGSLLGSIGYLPAYHMNKSSWITILLDETLPNEEIFQMLDISFALTWPQKPKKQG